MYVLEILSETGISSAKPISTPLERIISWSQIMKIFLTCLIVRVTLWDLTRAELAFVVYTLAQFIHKPRQAHWFAALRVVQYLKGYPGQGILLGADSPLILIAYCDSD